MIDGVSADIPQPKPFQVGEILYHNGGDQLKVSGFRNDAASLPDGGVLHKTAVAFNFLDDDSKPVKSGEIAIYGTRGVQTDAASSSYLKRQIGEVLDSKASFEGLPPDRQQAVQEAYNRDGGSSLPDGDRRADLFMTQAYLEQQKREVQFNQAKAAAQKTT